MKYAISFVLLVLPMLAPAEELMVFNLVIRDHLFYPSRLEVPARMKFKLVIENLDDTPEEFDSFDLNREKVIFPRKKSTIYVGPLEPGSYGYFGEYNINTAQGTITAVRDFVPEDRDGSGNSKGDESDVD